MATRTKAAVSLGSVWREGLTRVLPGISAALDPTVMRGHLQAALVGVQGAATVQHCVPAQAVLLDDDCCIVRYKLAVEDPAGRRVPALVTGRVYADPGQAAAYAAERLAPLAAQARGRAEVAPFATSVALVEPLSMAVHAYPVDGDLPTLAAATDPQVAAHALGGLLATSGLAADGEVEVERCHAEPVHYNRRHRCMLRYHLDLAGGRRLVLYGKVANDGAGARTPAVVDALHGTLAAARVALPECLGFCEDLQLVVLTAIPGTPQVAQLLAARSRGEPAAAAAAGGLALEGAVEACGQIAAALHSSGLRLGPPRPLEDELAELRTGLAPMLHISPAVGARLHRWLDLVEARGATTPAQDVCQCHGDYSYTQLLFDGPRAGLVDFDTVCQAEPALDLGRFLSYLRLAEVKARGAGRPPRAELTERLAGRFAAAYTAAGGGAAVLERVGVYEAVSLIRMAEHAWQNLKAARLEHLVTVLDERLGLDT